MTTDDRPRVLYGLRHDGCRYRRRARLLAHAFERAGHALDCLVGGPGRPRLLPSGSVLDTSPGQDTPLASPTPLPDATSLPSGAGSLRRLRGVDGFDADRYDLVLSETEPLSARIGRLRDVPCFGIGHALDPGFLRSESTSDMRSRWRLPGHTSTPYLLSSDWRPERPWTLPPLVDPALRRVRMAQDYTLVFLPEKELVPLVSLLSQLRSKHFIVYSPAVRRASQRQNVSLYPTSDGGFLHHLQRANRLLCHFDAELVAQASHLGLPILVTAGVGDAVRERGASVLAKNGIARTTRALGVLSLERFVESVETIAPANYPDVAREIVHHCLHEDPRDIESLAARLWARSSAASPRESVSGSDLAAA